MSLLQTEAGAIRSLTEEKDYYKDRYNKLKEANERTGRLIFLIFKESEKYPHSAAHWQSFSEFMKDIIDKSTRLKEL